MQLHCGIPDDFYRNKIYWFRQQTDDQGTINEYLIDSDYHTIDYNRNLIFLQTRNEESSSFQNNDSPYFCKYVSPNTNKRLNGSLIHLNGIDDGSDSFELAPYSLHISPSKISVLENNKLNLYCAHGGYPLLNISWFKNGMKLNKCMPKPTDFFLNHIKLSKGGIYECHVSNGIGSNLTLIFEVNVEPNVYWIEYQKPQLKYERNSAPI